MDRSTHVSGARRFYGWALTRLYHELAPAYELVAWLVSAGRWAGWRRRALPLVVGPRVLELGPGTGALLAAMASAGHAAVGVEPSPAMLRQASRRVRGRAALVRATAGALPFRDGAFDSVAFTFPTNYALAPAAAREAARVLRPGGRLVVVDGGLRLGRPAGAPALPYEDVLAGAGFRLRREVVVGRLFTLIILSGERPEESEAIR